MTRTLAAYAVLKTLDGIEICDREPCDLEVDPQGIGFTVKLSRMISLHPRISATAYAVICGAESDHDIVRFPSRNMVRDFDVLELVPEMTSSAPTVEP